MFIHFPREVAQKLNIPSKIGRNRWFRELNFPQKLRSLLCSAANTTLSMRLPGPTCCSTKQAKKYEHFDILQVL